jgi:hypothetical protein
MSAQYHSLVTAAAAVRRQAPKGARAWSRALPSLEVCLYSGFSAWICVCVGSSETNIYMTEAFFRNEKFGDLGPENPSRNLVRFCWSKMHKQVCNIGRFGQFSWSAIGILVRPATKRSSFGQLVIRLHWLSANKNPKKPGSPGQASTNA